MIRAGCRFSFTYHNKSFPTYAAYFKLLGAVVSEKSLTYPLCIIERSKNGKRRQKLISASWISFLQYTWPFSRCVQNLKTAAAIGAEISVTESVIEEKENLPNRGNYKQDEADSLLYKTTYHTKHLYQILKYKFQFLRNF